VRHTTLHARRPFATRYGEKSGVTLAIARKIST
jgi:hypothetical protein